MSKELKSMVDSKQGFRDRVLLEQATGILGQTLEQSQEQSVEPRLTKFGYKLQKKVADGGFGVVFDVVQLTTGTRCALKEVNRKKLAEKNIDYQIESERYYLHKLKHFKFVINMLDSFDDGDLTMTVLRYAEKGDIDTYVDKYGHVDYNLARYFIIQIISAVNYLHHNNIIHRDLKPNNILIMNDWNIAVCDFMTAGPIKADGYRQELVEWHAEQRQGFAGRIKAPELNRIRGNKYVGTAIYMSPEIAKSRKRPGILENRVRRESLAARGFTADQIDDMEQTTAADNWSIGCIIYFMMTGHPPFLMPSVLGTQSSHRRAGLFSMNELDYVPMRAVSPDLKPDVLAARTGPRLSQPIQVPRPKHFPNSPRPGDNLTSQGDSTSVRIDTVSAQNLTIPPPDSFPNRNYYGTFPQLGFFDRNINASMQERELLLFTQFTREQLQGYGQNLPSSVDCRVCAVLDALVHPIAEKRANLADLLKFEMFTGDPGNKPVKSWDTTHVLQEHTTPPIGLGDWNDSHVFAVRIARDASSGSGSHEMPIDMQPSIPTYPILPTARPVQAIVSPRILPSTEGWKLDHHSDMGLLGWSDHSLTAVHKSNQRNSGGLSAKWDKVLGEDEIIIKMGVMKKRRGYYSIKTRMFILTYSPSQCTNRTKGIRFSYYDQAKFEKYGYDPTLPLQKRCYKGEIPLTDQVKERYVVSMPDFVSLTIETPGRVYYLSDKDGTAQHWKHAIDDVMKSRYGAENYDP